MALWLCESSYSAARNARSLERLLTLALGLSQKLRFFWNGQDIKPHNEDIELTCYLALHVHRPFRRKLGTGGAVDDDAERR
jgi:hypothetical protein